MAGNRVEHFRQALKLSRGELAEVIGEDEAAVQRYETGDSLPPETAHKLAAMFGVSVPFLLGEE